jgi:hypothetical protein
MTVTALEEIKTWDQWQKANALMRTAVETALEAKNKAPDNLYPAANENYSWLLKQWKRLKTLGLELVDAEIAAGDVPGRIVQTNAAIAKKADEIAKLAKSINDIAKLTDEVAKIGKQFDGLLGLFAKLAL